MFGGENKKQFRETKIILDDFRFHTNWGELNRRYLSMYTKILIGQPQSARPAFWREGDGAKMQIEVEVVAVSALELGGKASEGESEERESGKRRWKEGDCGWGKFLHEGINTESRTE